MEYALVGWPDEGPQLRLDHREFSYAGKFVMSNTGKAVARDDGDLVGAIAFNEDRTDPATAWLRYVTVRTDRRGEGVGAELAAFAADRLESRGYDRVKIAVNNPFAYHALHKAGFGYTGEHTGIAEAVLVRPGDRSPATYREGLAAYRERDDLADDERAFIDAKVEAGPPDAIPAPE